jgi:hypothetical protein
MGNRSLNEIAANYQTHGMASLLRISTRLRRYKGASRERKNLAGKGKAGKTKKNSATAKPMQLDPTARDSSMPSMKAGGTSLECSNALTAIRPFCTEQSRLLTYAINDGCEQ